MTKQVSEQEAQEYLRGFFSVDMGMSLSTSSANCRIMSGGGAGGSGACTSLVVENNRFESIQNAQIAAQAAIHAAQLEAQCTKLEMVIEGVQMGKQVATKHIARLTTAPDDIAAGERVIASIAFWRVIPLLGWLVCNCLADGLDRISERLEREQLANESRT